VVTRSDVRTVVGTCSVVIATVAGSVVVTGGLVETSAVDTSREMVVGGSVVVLGSTVEAAGVERSSVACVDSSVGAKVASVLTVSVKGRAVVCSVVSPPSPSVELSAEGTSVEAAVGQFVTVSSVGAIVAAADCEISHTYDFRLKQLAVSHSPFESFIATHCLLPRTLGWCFAQLV
jgi:hypothetical protein